MTEPLTPADCDLQDFTYMPLDVRRLRDSDLAATESPEACWCAVLLWAASWHQVPAASLPDDDRVLSNLAGFGRVVAEWQRVKEGALRGWVKCSDGRLYHPVVAEKANESWAAKQAHAHGKLKERIRKSHGKDAYVPGYDEWISAGKPKDWEQPYAGIPPENAPIPPENKDLPAEPSRPSTGIPLENALKGEVREREREICIGTLSPQAAQPAAKGSRLSADWVLPDDWAVWAKNERPDLDPSAVADQFRDYWVSKPGKDGRKSDWMATWRNWVRGQRSPGANGGKSVLASKAALNRNSDEYAEAHKSASWWRDAGFPSVWAAIASRCWHDNADQFHDGQRVEVAA